MPCTNNPLGVKGAGEAGAIGSCPAVMNAIVDALVARLRHPPSSTCRRPAAASGRRSRKASARCACKLRLRVASGIALTTIVITPLAVSVAAIRGIISGASGVCRIQRHRFACRPSVLLTQKKEICDDSAHRHAGRIAACRRRQRAVVAQSDPIAARKALMKAQGAHRPYCGPDDARPGARSTRPRPTPPSRHLRRAAEKLPTLFPDNSKTGDKPTGRRLQIWTEQGRLQRQGSPSSPRM